jgi:tRNA pseudouridine55 synthase
VRWGEQRTTDDLEGEVMETSDVRPTADAITAALPAFTGEIEQTPPKFSAIKIDGQRAYDLARDGAEFEIQSRIVYIDSLELLDAREDEADLVMHCGKGTYVRSLARDLAIMLGTFGHVSALRRTAVGPFTLDNAISLAQLEEMGDSPDEFESLLPLETALDDIPALAIKGDEATRLKNGNAVPFISKMDFDRLSKAGLDEEGEALAVYKGKPIALVTRVGPEIQPFRVFNI